MPTLIVLLVFAPGMLWPGGLPAQEPRAGLVTGSLIAIHGCGSVKVGAGGTQKAPC